MNIVYCNKNIYIDLEGDINLKYVINKIILLKDNYLIDKFYINTCDMFNYSNYKIKKLKSDLKEINVNFVID